MFPLPRRRNEPSLEGDDKILNEELVGRMLHNCDMIVQDLLCNVMNIDRRTTVERNFSLLRKASNTRLDMVFLFIMGALKKKGCDQPMLFIGFLLRLDAVFGYDTPLGPFRILLTADDFPITTAQWNYHQKWLYERGQIKEPDYKVDLHSEKEDWTRSLAKEMADLPNLESAGLPDVIPLNVSEYGFSEAEVNWDPDEVKMTSPAETAAFTTPTQAAAEATETTALAVEIDPWQLLLKAPATHQPLPQFPSTSPPTGCGPVPTMKAPPKCRIEPVPTARRPQQQIYKAPLEFIQAAISNMQPGQPIGLLAIQDHEETEPIQTQVVPMITSTVEEPEDWLWQFS